MLFLQRKTKDGYEYETEDFIGKITLYSLDLLDKATLDACILKISHQDSSEGEIQAKQGIIKFKFIKSNQWLE